MKRRFIKKPTPGWHTKRQPLQTVEYFIQIAQKQNNLYRNHKNDWMNSDNLNHLFFSATSPAGDFKHDEELRFYAERLHGIYQVTNFSAMQDVNL